MTDNQEMKYRIVIRNILNNRVTPLTKYFDSKAIALDRLQDYTSELASHLIYDIEAEA